MNININKDYSEETCIHCGVVFYFPSTMHRFVKDNKINIYCPSGHSMAYIKSKADILAEQLEGKNLEISTLRKELSAKVIKNKKKK